MEEPEDKRRSWVINAADGRKITQVFTTFGAARAEAQRYADRCRKPVTIAARLADMGGGYVTVHPRDRA